MRCHAILKKDGAQRGLQTTLHQSRMSEEMSLSNEPVCEVSLDKFESLDIHQCNTYEDRALLPSETPSLVNLALFRYFEIIHRQQTLCLGSQTSHGRHSYN